MKFRPHRTWLAFQAISAAIVALVAARANDAVPVRVAQSGWRAAVADLAARRHRIAVKVDTVHALEPLRPGYAALFSSFDIVFAARPLLADAATTTPSVDHDLFRARVRFDPEGAPIAIAAPVNLTSTEAADESTVAARGPRIAFAARVADRYQGLTLLDFRGEAIAITQSWRGFERVMNQITNWQRTGAARGIDERSFEFKEPPTDLTLAFDGEELVVRAKDDRGRVREGRVTAGGERVHADWLLPVARQKSPTELVQWAVNTVRELPFVGAEFIAWLEQRVYKAQDDIRGVLDRLGLISAKVPTGVSTASSDDDSETIDPTAAAAAAPAPTGLNATPATAIGFDATWPPQQIEPLRHAKWKQTLLPGEGKWASVGEPTITTRPGFAPPFYKTFIRTDPDREYARVVIVLADVRQLELSIVAGVDHPQPTTGHKGTGLIPRTPDTIGRLVAAFNGGFQAMHGKAGMVVDRKAMLYPVAGLGTIATKLNGDVAFFTWPKDWKPTELPPEIRSVRQNLAALIDDGKFNPRGQKRWGYALPGGDSTYVHRSAVGVTRDGHLMYAFGPSLSAETLAAGMTHGGAVYAIHLDMNPWHCAFEFFKVADGVGKKYKATKLDPAQVFRFPRYLSRADPRDFFYLAYRSAGEVGSDLLKPFPLPTGAKPGPADEGLFTTAGLPPVDGPLGIPPPWARATVRSDPASPAPNLSILSLDPARVRALVTYGTAEPPSPTGFQAPAPLSAWPPGFGLAVRLARTDPKTAHGLMVGGRIVFPPRIGLPTIAVTADGELRLGTLRGTTGLVAFKQGIPLVHEGRAADADADMATPIVAFGSTLSGKRLLLAHGVATPGQIQAALLRAGVVEATFFRAELEQAGTVSPAGTGSMENPPSEPLLPELLALDPKPTRIFLKALPTAPRAYVTARK